MTEYCKFVKHLYAATAKVEAAYFQLPVAGAEDPIYRERVYTYELYHRLREGWPLDGYSLGGEVDKTNHPKIRGNNLDYKKPDYIVHVPREMEKNLLVAEVKPANVRRENLKKDLECLTAFCVYAQYQNAFLLIYGSNEDTPTQIREMAKTSSSESSEKINLDLIDFFWHPASGKSAQLIQWET